MTKQLIDEKLNKIYHIIRMKKATYFFLFATVNDNRGIISHTHDSPYLNNLCVNEPNSIIFRCPLQ